MIEYKFSQLINGIENLPESLLNYNSVLYRIHDKSLNMNYIGTAKYGMPNRLYDGFNGHVHLYRTNNKTRCKGMYHSMNERLEDFYLIIEDSDSPDNYDRILQKETELIKSYDSVLFGYNMSLDGKPGWKKGSLCVNDGEYDLYIYPEDVPRFLERGYSLGSCKHGFLKDTIWITNGSESKMIDPSDFPKYEKLGYSKGSGNKPNKNKVWMNDGTRSTLVPKDLIGSQAYSNYINYGRIENSPRKKRGKYKGETRKFINNGEKCLRIPISKVNDFLREHPDYKEGRIMKKK